MIYTFGHSTLSEPAALEVLRGKVTTVIDVRSHPGSKWPQFNRENLQRWLPEAGVGYEWWPELGGWDRRHLPLAEEMSVHGVDLPVYARGKFPKQRIGKSFFPDPGQAVQEVLPGIVRPYWNNQGLWDYEWFMSLDEFLDGADRLVERGAKEDVAIMCCEVLWWKCHRSMVADYLAFKGVEAIHLQPKVTPHSKALGNRLDRYEPEVRAKWSVHRPSTGSDSVPAAVA